MFCSSCGAEATGNFCSECGAPVPRTASDDPLPENWSEVVEYATLIRIPAVRNIIDRHAAIAPKRLSGEDFLALCDRVVSLGVPLERIAAVSQDFYARLGVKTSKEHSETLMIPPGTAIVASLCSLASGGHPLQEVRQFDDGCLLKAELPADVWSFGGELLVSVRRSQEGTRIDGATEIEGQAFDWGKSNRCLDRLFSDIKKLTEGGPEVS